MWLKQQKSCDSLSSLGSGAASSGDGENRAVREPLPNRRLTKVYSALNSHEVSSGRLLNFSDLNAEFRRRVSLTLFPVRPEGCRESLHLINGS